VIDLKIPNNPADYGRRFFLKECLYTMFMKRVNKMLLEILEHLRHVIFISNLFVWMYSACAPFIKFLFSAAIAGGFTSVIREQCTIEPSAPNQPVCVNISTMEDNVLESTELFTVSLNSSDPGVLVNSTAADATVAIVDDDCE